MAASSAHTTASFAAFSALKSAQLRHKHCPYRLAWPAPRRLAFPHLCQPNYQRSRAAWIFPIAMDAATVVIPKPDDVKYEEDPTTQDALGQITEVTISAVMSDVSNLVKLVDSRDIVEFELKHLDYELVIRKKEALAPAAPPAPQIFAQASYPTYAPPPMPGPAASSPLAAAASSPAPEAAPSPAAATPPVTSSLPRILSPMAGTLYKSPAPGEPSFVKVGDKVSKGQVICIVEAMKLMNEIEADQSGTIVEILAEDGKPVAVDTPLFSIKP